MELHGNTWKIEDCTVNSANPAPNLQPLLEKLGAMHKHLCPRQILGVRMGLYAGEFLGLELPQHDKRLFTFVETDGCFVDGVMVSTGCSVGHRTLRLMDYGKVAASFVDTKTGEAIRVWPSRQCRVLAKDYAPTAPNSWRAQFEGYQVMPAPKLLSVSPITLQIDLKALIAQPGGRVHCAVCGEEILNQRNTIRNGQVLCLGCAEGGYARILSNGR
jgi:formylmethanofuran dehydrogenase subunit E